MTYGWTGNRCKQCSGRGEVLDDYGVWIACDACGGSGHEWGELPDEPIIKEPEQ